VQDPKLWALVEEHGKSGAILVQFRFWFATLRASLWPEFDFCRCQPLSAAGAGA
jgi:hypothetical protein